MFLVIRSVTLVSSYLLHFRISSQTLIHFDPLLLLQWSNFQQFYLLPQIGMWVKYLQQISWSSTAAVLQKAPVDSFTKFLGSLIKDCLLSDCRFRNTLQKLRTCLFCLSLPLTHRHPPCPHPNSLCTESPWHQAVTAATAHMKGRTHRKAHVLTYVCAHKHNSSCKCREQRWIKTPSGFYGLYIWTLPLAWVFVRWHFQMLCGFLQNGF